MESNPQNTTCIELFENGECATKTKDYRQIAMVYIIGLVLAAVVFLLMFSSIKYFDMREEKKRKAQALDESADIELQRVSEWVEIDLGPGQVGIDYPLREPSKWGDKVHLRG